MPVKTNVMRILQTAGVPFDVYTFDPKGQVDAISVASFIHEPVEQVFKTLVTQAPTQTHSFEHFVFVIPADSSLDLKKAAKAAGVKSLEMLPLKQLLPLTGYIHGGCSPIGMKKPFPTFIEETAQLFDSICISGGKIGVTLKINPERLAAFIEAPFVPLTKDETC